jgi:alanine racemase
MNSHPHRAWVEIDLGALLRNAAALRRFAGVPLLAVVKADAYGLGALRVVDALSSVDPWGFGVATIDEGAALRDAGVSSPVVVLTPPLPPELRAYRERRLTPCLSSAPVIAEWGELGGGAWHLAVETGMNRMGARWSDVAELARLLRAFPPQGAFTHFHSAELDDGSMETQEARFREAVQAMPARPPLLHAENSAAIARRAGSEWDLARPGVFLYGVGSGPAARIQPEPVVALRARIVEVSTVHEGDTVSYGATWRAPGDRLVATVALGYADGYRRAFSNRGHAIVNGGRAAVVGVVTMDMTMLDVTGLGCRVGDVATFLGGSKSDSVPIGPAAESAALSPYELLTGLKSRLPRVYISPARAL